MTPYLIALVVIVLILVAFDYLAPYPAARIGLTLERMRCGLTAKKTAIPGFEIAYLEGGKGEPLMLIHGFGGDKDHFTRVSAKLTGRYHVIIPDLPGFGESSRPDNVTYTIDEQIERVRAFARQLGITRMHLGGNSMGGGIAMAYAAKYPDEVASLWLLAPAGTEAAFDSELTRRIKETGENFLLMRSHEDFARTERFVMFRHPWVPHSVKYVLAERGIADYDLHSRIFDQIVDGPRIESIVTRLDTPALVVWGKQDRALNPKGADAVKALMPNADVLLIDDMGHIPMVEAPGDSARDYLRFREGIEAAGAKASDG
ncbi:MAG: alpha/beta fold hydrolase [Deltaproteobacteria bacterium]|nr:alpha/beta fold hydrolase [Deltaproteobacteria bacterium]